MATTTNFGWETPDDTDLVKDGAAAMRTLGNAIDTSFVDLKGGTTNQVLAKNSNTDLDFKWVADATGIPATIIDAKGDLIAGTAADTADRLAVGTNGHVLTADSSTATGIKWAAIPASTPSFVGCSVYRSNNIDISTATYTNVTFSTELYDTDGFHSTSTNTERMTIPAGKAGKYLIIGKVAWESTSAHRYELRVQKNVSDVLALTDLFAGTGANAELVVVHATLAESDYIYLQVYQASGSTRTLTGGNSYTTYFQIQYLGA